MDLSSNGHGWWTIRLHAPRTQRKKPDRSKTEATPLQCPTTHLVLQWRSPDSAPKQLSSMKPPSSLNHPRGREHAAFSTVEWQPRLSAGQMQGSLRRDSLWVSSARAAPRSQGVHEHSRNEEIVAPLAFLWRSALRGFSHLALFASGPLRILWGLHTLQRVQYALLVSL